jgi:hypothetical protein
MCGKVTQIGQYTLPDGLRNDELDRGIAFDLCQNPREAWESLQPPAAPRRDPTRASIQHSLLHHVLHRARKRPVTVNLLPALTCVFSIGLTGFEPVTP